MGCGQSKIGIYQKKSKTRKSGSKRSDASSTDASVYRQTVWDATKHEDGGESEEDTEEPDEKIVPNTKNAKDEIDGERRSDPLSGKIRHMAQHQHHSHGRTIMAHSYVSPSQLEFFRMLDEKIESGPDYAEEDDEEEAARLAQLVEEWKAASMASERKRHEPIREREKWPSPSRNIAYTDDYGPYPLRGTYSVDTQRFPTGYSPCPPPANIGMHLQNAFRPRVFSDQPRIQPRIPYHSYQRPMDPHHRREGGHPLSSAEPPNPLRHGYPHPPLRHPPMMAHRFPQGQRMFHSQYPDSPRAYVEPRSYAHPRVMPPVNVLHEQRSYHQEGRPYPERVYQDARQNFLYGYQEPQRPDVPRLLPDSQRIYHERMMEGQRPRMAFHRPPLMPQRPFQEPPRMYRDVEPEECFPRQDRFEHDGHPTRAPNFKMGRSSSADTEYIPPPPREMLPHQGAPGPPQGSPRPLAARGPHMGMHRLPTSPAAQFRKSRGGFSDPA